MIGKENIAEKKKERAIKTYKVHPFHYILFYSCLSICQRDKLTDYLIQTYLGKDTKELPTYSKAELFEFTILQIEKKNISELQKLHQNKRIEDFRMFFNAQNKIWDGTKGFFQTFCKPDVHEIIRKKSKETETIGEIIESAIENYIINTDEFHYNLIKLVFEKSFDEFFNSISFKKKATKKEHT